MDCLHLVDIRFRIALDLVESAEGVADAEQFYAARRFPLDRNATRTFEATRPVLSGCTGQGRVAKVQSRHGQKILGSNVSYKMDD